MHQALSYIASIEEVTIRRCGNAAIIKYKDGRVLPVHFDLGPAVDHLTDKEILNRWNDYVGAQVELNHDHQDDGAAISRRKPK